MACFWKLVWLVWRSLGRPFWLTLVSFGWRRSELALAELQSWIHHNEESIGVVASHVLLLLLSEVPPWETLAESQSSLKRYPHWILNGQIQYPPLISEFHQGLYAWLIVWHLQARMTSWMIFGIAAEDLHGHTVPMSDTAPAVLKWPFRGHSQPADHLEYPHWILNGQIQYPPQSWDLSTGGPRCIPF